MAQTAGAYRSLLRQNFPYFEPGQLVCDTMGVPNKLVHFFEILINLSFKQFSTIIAP